MGTSRGMYLELRHPLLLIEKDGMPVNLGRAYYEDRPENPIPAVPFHALNVMPTPLGYKSFFQPLGFYRDNPDTPDPTEGLQNVNFQDIFSYQTINAYNISIGLVEGGIYAYSGTNVSTSSTEDLHYWTKIAEVPFDTGIKFLWTRCVLDNIVYMYHQGDDLLYALVDYAEYNERLLSDPDMQGIYVSEFYQFGIIAKKPTFLNMEGQVGIFKADNRLGFWDTDNSVAWSSAINKYDFKPDATTFAGNTKFTSVAGSITTILSSGRGFVIYATASVIRIDPASSSERWTSTPIFAKIGVLYPEQVTCGAEDTTHYFWATSGGIYEFSGITAKPYEPELSAFFRTQGPITYLKYLAGKYLFVDIAAQEIRDSGAERYGRQVYDGRGNPFIANPPPRFDDPNYNAPFPLSLIQQASGMAPDLGLQDFEPEPEVFPDPGKDEALIPCYTGWKFVLPGGLVNLNTLGWSSSDTTDLDPANFPPIHGWTFGPTDYNCITAKRSNRFNNNSQYWSYEAGPITSPPGARFIDAAGDDFMAIINDSLDKLSELQARCFQLIGGSWRIANGKNTIGNTVMGLIRRHPSPFPNSYYGLPVPDRPDPYPEVVVPTAAMVVVPNLIVASEVIMEEDGCVIKLMATLADYEVSCDLVQQVTNEDWELVPGVPGKYRAIGYPGSVTYYTSFSHVAKEIPGSRRDVVVFQCEISGYGYFPYGGFSFRKTHSRSIFKPCAPTDSSSITIPIEDVQDIIDDNPVVTTLQYDPAASINPNDYQGYWDFNLRPVTPFVPSPPGYPTTDYQWAVFGKGVYNPYYPTMVKSFVKDMQLDRWGIYSDAHTILFDVLPVNRSERPQLLGEYLTDVSYLTQDTANIGAIFKANGVDAIADTLQYDGMPVLLMPFNNYSRITYGKIGLSRAGFTRLTGGSFNLGGFANIESSFAHVTIQASMNNADYVLKDFNGVNVNEQIDFNLFGTKADEVPFTLDGRWFTMTVMGQFDLQFVALYGHDAGRLRFIQNPEEDPE